MPGAPSSRCGRRSTTATRQAPTSSNPGVEHGAVGCGNGHGERMPIDYLILGKRLAGRLVPGSYRVWNYPEGGRWPDHCVISIELERET